MTTRTKQFHRYAITGFVAFLTLAGTTGNAWAGSACLRPRAAHAFATAAMQQRLMVAALTCNQTPLYNHFVIQYRGALRRSDADLAHYFKHHGGMAGYHAYKTKLANSASLESLKGVRSYCANSASLFHSALDSGKVSLVMLAEQAAPESARACDAKSTRVAERGKAAERLRN